MSSGFIRHLPVAVASVALLGAALLPGGTAAADSRDDKFFELLGQKDIPPVDNANSLIETAHKACSKLDSGMSVVDLVDLIRNNGYNENPLTRLNPADRITRTINQFITASVQAYCPYDAGKIASIAAYERHGSRGVVVALASVTEALPAGEIPPTKPLPVPAQPPPPPEQLAPAPQEPPPRHVQQAPQRQQQVEPPPQEAPPQEAPPQADQPQAPAPAPEPGGGNGGAPAPESPSPAPPAPPGHIRLAP